MATAFFTETGQPGQAYRPTIILVCCRWFEMLVSIWCYIIYWIQCSISLNVCCKAFTFRYVTCFPPTEPLIYKICISCLLLSISCAVSRCSIYSQKRSRLFWNTWEKPWRVLFIKTLLAIPLFTTCCLSIWHTRMILIVRLVFDIVNIYSPSMAGMSQLFIYQWSW